MANYICSICQKKIGMLAPKTAISDGYICAKCLKSAKIPDFPNSLSYTNENIRDFFNNQLYILKIFKPTKTVKNLSITHLSIDENNKLFKVNDKEIFEFSNLLDDGIITEEEFNAKKKQLLGL